MSRRARRCPGGFVYHVWNRAAGRLRLFATPSDYLAFERILLEAHQKHPLPLLDWALMPNHWHFVVFPRDDKQVTEFFKWLTHTHAMRSIAHKRTMGMGALYQGRFKSMPVQNDDHLLTLLRYVQRNPVRAKLARSAADWRWGSEWTRRQKPAQLISLLADWPIDRPRDWANYVDEPQTSAELDALRQCIRRSRPWGNPSWTLRTARKLNLDWTINPRGRPHKHLRDEQRATSPLLKGT